jgi:hypothetical protein
MDEHVPPHRVDLDEPLLEVEATDIGWRLGRQGYQPDVPLRALPLHARAHARTFILRSALRLTPRLRVLVGWAFAEGYVEGALQEAWCWAYEHGDAALADEVETRNRFANWWP